MAEDFKKFLIDIQISKDSIDKLLRLYDKGGATPSDVRKIIVPELGNKIALINEVTNRINNGNVREATPLANEVKLETETKPIIEENLYTKILTENINNYLTLKKTITEINPGMDTIPEIITQYLNTIDNILKNIDDYEKNGNTRYNDEPTMLLKKKYAKEHFKYGPIIETLAYNNLLTRENINQSNANITTIENTIKILENELRDFENTEKTIKPTELDILDIVHLRGFMTYNDLKKNEKKQLTEWTYRKILHELPIISSKLENYDPMLQHDEKLVKSRIQNLRNDINYLEVNKDIISKIDPSVNETIRTYRTVLDKIKQYE